MATFMMNPYDKSLDLSDKGEVGNFVKLFEKISRTREL